MCSVTEDIEELNISCAEFSNLQKGQTEKNNSVCRKCGSIAIILLQKKDPYCKPCFLEYCHHKFKATIGKAKKMKPEHKVLLAYSCGAKSAAMLHMVLQAINDSSPKKFLFQIGVLFIDESVIFSENFEEINKSLQNISQLLQNSNCPLLYTPLEMVFRHNHSCEQYYWPFNSPSIVTDSLKNEFLKSLNNIKSLTSKLDYIECLKRQLLLDVTKSEHYTHIFTGDSATDLATKFLSQIAVGRGSQVSLNTAFYDTQYEIPICRPMREFLNKEIVYYNHLKGISSVSRPSLITKADPHSCIQRLTESFVNGLQDNFPSTVFTIFRTGDKISSTCGDNPMCVLCKSPKDNVKPNICSALEALSISEKVSMCEKSETEDKEFYVLKNFLCHGCQVILCDVNDYVLPPFVTNEIKKLSHLDMKEEIKKFLLDDCE